MQITEQTRKRDILTQSLKLIEVEITIEDQKEEYYIARFAKGETI